MIIQNINALLYSFFRLKYDSKFRYQISNPSAELSAYFKQNPAFIAIQKINLYQQNRDIHLLTEIIRYIHPNRQGAREMIGLVRLKPLN